MASQKNPLSMVLLVAEDENGTVIEQLDVSYDEYYDGGLPIVDSNEFRKDRSIRLLKGKIYGHKRNLLQEFAVQYDNDGNCTRSRTIHEDGTVVED